MKILIIDDEQAIAQVFQQTLQKAGHEVVIAATGKEGEEKALIERPDLILLDQILPDINGNQVLQNIKAQETLQTTPVAILSNFNQDGLVGDAMKFGAADYILKYQISPQDLVEKVNQLLTAKNGTGWQDTHDEGI